MALPYRLPQSAKRKRKTLELSADECARIVAPVMVQSLSDLFERCEIPGPGIRIRICTHPLYALGLLFAYAMVDSLTIDREF